MRPIVGALKSSEQIDALNHLRWLAAFAVLISHARSFIFQDFGSASFSYAAASFYFLTGFGHLGVVVFFVLSGYLIGRKIEKIVEDPCLSRGIRKYLMDRFFRIAVPLWPALLLSFAIYVSLLKFFPHTEIVVNIIDWIPGWIGDARSDMALNVWISNMLLTNEILTKSISINGAVWSLAYEWFYYVVSALLFLRVLLLKRVRFGLFDLYGITLLVLVFLFNIKIIIAYPLWFIGWIAERVQRRNLLLAPFHFWLAIAVVVVSCFVWRIFHINDFWVAISIAYLLSVSRLKNRKLFTRLGVTLSSFSYSVYLIHVPLLVLAVAVSQSFGALKQKINFSIEGVLYICAAVALVLSISWVFSFMTEKRTVKIRNLLQLGN